MIDHCNFFSDHDFFFEMVMIRILSWSFFFKKWSIKNRSKIEFFQNFFIFFSSVSKNACLLPIIVYFMLNLIFNFIYDTQNLISSFRFRYSVLKKFQIFSKKDPIFFQKKVMIFFGSWPFWEKSHDPKKIMTFFSKWSWSFFYRSLIDLSHYTLVRLYLFIFYHYPVHFFIN